MGLTLLSLTVMAAARSSQNLQCGWKQSERSKRLADEAERMWLEIHLGISLGSRETTEGAWSLVPMTGPYEVPLLKLTEGRGEQFYIAAPK